MIPQYSRVVAIDDNEDHLQKIVWGLGKAGFSAIPFHVDDGKLEAPPSQPLLGVRIVFTDIHMVGGAMTQSVIHASNIIKCLKRIIAGGPYVLIFWSQYPGDTEEIQRLILERAEGAKLTPPIGFGSIDKKEVFAASHSDILDGFDAIKLRDLIFENIAEFKTLAVAISWEERTASAAARTTNRLFELVRDSGQPSEDWERLLAFLATEAIGQESAKKRLISALDSALLPLLEDQLQLIGDEPTAPAEDLTRLLSFIEEAGFDCPKDVIKSKLNTSYLIEEIPPGADADSCSRGMVSCLGGSYLNSGPFLNAFHYDVDTLIQKEFATRELSREEKSKVKLHIVELGPECDHVQGKIGTQRYLLSILVPSEIYSAFVGTAAGKPIKSIRYKNDSIIDIGRVHLNHSTHGEYHLLISSRCFMTLPAKAAVHCTPKFRLRRALLEEVAHRYITYARRPGVMRFKY